MIALNILLLYRYIRLHRVLEIRFFLYLLYVNYVLASLLRLRKKLLDWVAKNDLPTLNLFLYQQREFARRALCYDANLRDI